MSTEEIERILKALYDDTLKEPIDQFKKLLAKLR